MFCIILMMYKHFSLNAAEQIVRNSFDISKDFLIFSQTIVRIFSKFAKLAKFFTIKYLINK